MTQMNGAFGHKIFNGTSLAYMNLSQFPTYNALAKAPESKIYDQSISDYWLEKGNYLNIDYITLGYQHRLQEDREIREEYPCDILGEQRGYDHGLLRLISDD